MLRKLLVLLGSSYRRSRRGGWGWREWTPGTDADSQQRGESRRAAVFSLAWQSSRQLMSAFARVLLDAAAGEDAGRTDGLFLKTETCGDSISAVHALLDPSTLAVTRTLASWVCG